MCVSSLFIYWISEVYNIECFTTCNISEFSHVPCFRSLAVSKLWGFSFCICISFARILRRSICLCLTLHVCALRELESKFSWKHDGPSRMCVHLCRCDQGGNEANSRLLNQRATKAGTTRIKSIIPPSQNYCSVLEQTAYEAAARYVFT